MRENSVFKMQMLIESFSIGTDTGKSAIHHDSFHSSFNRRSLPVGCDIDFYAVRFHCLQLRDHPRRWRQQDQVRIWLFSHPQLKQ